jgi:chromosome segregation ATPase
MGENQKKLENLKKQIDDSNKKKAELERKKNDIEKTLVPYKKLLEDVGKAKENIETQARKKRALIDLEIKDDETRNTLNNNINSAKQEVDDKIDALEKDEIGIRSQQTSIEEEIKANNDTIANFESLKNYPKTLKIEDDIKKFTEFKGKLEKEQNISRSSYLLDHELKVSSSKVMVNLA